MNKIIERVFKESEFKKSRKSTSYAIVANFGVEFSKIGTRSGKSLPLKTIFMEKTNTP